MGRFEKFQISSRGFNDSIDITRLVISAVKKQGAMSGVVQIFAPDFTSCVVAVPKGVPIVQDLHEIIGEFIPVDKIYQFDEKYNTNAYAHLRSVFLGNSISLPFENGEIDLGNSQIVFIDFDNKPNQKIIKVHISG